MLGLKLIHVSKRGHRRCHINIRTVPLPRRPLSPSRHSRNETWRNQDDTWWRHQMEIFSALLTLCAGNSPVTGEFPTQRPVTRSFDVYFDLRPNERLSKQWWGWWFETLSRSSWRHRNDLKKTPNLSLKILMTDGAMLFLTRRISCLIFSWQRQNMRGQSTRHSTNRCDLYCGVAKLWCHVFSDGQIHCFSDGAWPLKYAASQAKNSV